MSDLAFVALAYGIVWSLLFGYVFTLGHREQELRRDLGLITGVLREREILPPESGRETAHVPESQPLEARAPSSAT